MSEFTKGEWTVCGSVREADFYISADGHQVCRITKPTGGIVESPRSGRKRKANLCRAGNVKCASSY